MWYFYADAPESFIRGASESAGYASKHRCVLSREKIPNERHVSVLIAVPFDFGRILSWELLAGLFVRFRQCS